MFKSLMRFKQKKDSICARPGCNNPIKREKNGTELNYCSSSCQMSHYSPGSSEFYDEFLDTPPYATSSNQWGVWSPNQEDAPPSYSSISNENDLFGSIDNVQVTPLWEADDDPPSNTSNSRYSSPPKLEDDFPIWLDSQVDPLWTHQNTSSRNSSSRNTSSRNTSNRNTSNRNTSRNYSPPATPRSNSPSDEEEVHCPQCTFFIRPNKTVCEMCGANITRQEPNRSNRSNRSNKSSSKPKSTISSYRDLYEEEDEDENEEEDEDEEDENPFADPTPRRNNQSSFSSRDNYKNSSSKSRNRSSYSSSDNYDNYSYDGYSQSRNQSSSRNRTSGNNRSSLYQSPTPPSDELWIDEDESYFESIPSRKTSRQRPLHKAYKPPSFLRDTGETESRLKRNVQKPPTPPLKEDQITCPACNFDNHLSMTHCEICYTQLNKTPEQDNKKNSGFNRIETRAKKACTTCSYYNDANSVQCEMCYRPMETIRKSIFTLPSFFSHDVNMTQCPVCTFMNHHSMAQCEMCRSELPGTNLKQQQQQYQQLVDNMPGPITKLIKLPLDDHDYMTVQQGFKNGVPNANILAIFRVIMPERIIKAHEAYKKQIAGNNPVATVTHRMYHGSHVACDAKRYYGPAGWKYCNAADCGLCGITQNGNSCAKSKYNGRMWFANSSQTSLGYCRNDPVKAMFVQEIISATGGAVIIVDKEAATLVKFLIIFQV